MCAPLKCPFAFAITFGRCGLSLKSQSLHRPWRFWATQEVEAPGCGWPNMFRRRQGFRLVDTPLPRIGGRGPDPSFNPFQRFMRLKLASSGLNRQTPRPLPPGSLGKKTIGEMGGLLRTLGSGYLKPVYQQVIVQGEKTI